MNATIRGLNASRRVVLSFALAALAAAAMAGPQPARADGETEAYIAGILAEADGFSSLDAQTRLARIEDLVDEHVDMRRVGRFVLGQYARVMTDAQRAAYEPLFAEYATSIYRKALSDYSGQALRVTGSVDRSPRDSIVTSRVADAQPGDPYANVEITWRVYRDAVGAMSVIDAGADGVWLAIEQQSQFKSVIANNGGGAKGVDALIADLRAKVGGGS